MAFSNETGRLRPHGGPSPRCLRPVLAGLLALAATGLVLSPGCGTSASDSPSLTILFTGTLLGKAEPCGCFSGDFGGLVRIAGYVKQAEQEVPAHLYFDLGDLLVDEHRMDTWHRAQSQLKARMMLDILADMGCSAWLPGDFDFALGRQTLEELAADAAFPFLLANVVDAQTGDPVFQRSKVFQVGDWRIGVFGLLGRRLNDPAQATAAEDLPVARRLANRGMRVLDPIETAAVIVPELRERCDLVFLLGHVGLPKAREIADAVPGIDVLLGAHFLKNDFLSERREKNGTHLCFIKIKGSRVGRIDFFGDPLDPGRVDRSQLREIEQGLLEDRRELEYLKARLAVREDRSDVQLRINARNRIAAAEESLAAAPEMGGDTVFEHYSVIIDHFAVSDAFADERMRKYHEATKAFWEERGPGHRVPPDPGNQMLNHVGYQACTSCHPHQYEFWKSTGHARAYATLEATDQALDVECFGCHTVAWRKQGGFSEPLGAQKLDFTNVQCEACHGPGSFHALGGDNTVMPGSVLRSPPSRTCENCHNSEHDPGFDFAEKLPRVACPQTPEGDPVLLAIRESAAASIRYRIEQGEEQYRAVLGRVLLSLQRYEEAREVLEAHVRNAPERTAGRLLLARAYLGCGENAEAVDLGRELLAEVPGVPTPYSVVAKALLAQDRSDEALAFLQDAVSRFPTRLDLLRLFGLLLKERFGLKGLEQWAERHLSNYPEAQGALDRIRAGKLFSEEPGG